MKMVRWLSATAGTAIVAATVVLPATAAFAAGPGSGNVSGAGNLSVGSGNTVNAPVSAPVSLCSISAGLLGYANSSCQGGADSSVSTSSGSGGGNGNTTGAGNTSLLSGNTVNAPVSVPVSVCGASVAAAGYANSHCRGGAHSRTSLGSGGSGSSGSSAGGNGNVNGIGNTSLASGNTINAPVSVPINVCSISLALLGFANSSCVGGATTDVSLSAADPADPAGPGDPADPGNGNTTGLGNTSLLSGNTINAPVSAPVDLCAVSVAVAGYANSGCRGGATADVRTPACHGSDCTTPPACTGTHCAPPQHQPPWHRPPWHHGTKPHGTSSGAGAGTAASTMSSSSGLLPTTGADLAGLAAGAAGLIALGGGTVVLTRRRRHGA
jgi:LPXTG-motif cell wall-anchored protein